MARGAPALRLRPPSLLSAPTPPALLCRHRVPSANAGLTFRWRPRSGQQREDPHCGFSGKRPPARPAVTASLVSRARHRIQQGRWQAVASAGDARSVPAPLGGSISPRIPGPARTRQGRCAPPARAWLAMRRLEGPSAPQVPLDYRVRPPHGTRCPSGPWTGGREGYRHDGLPTIFGCLGCGRDIAAVFVDAALSPVFLADRTSAGTQAPRQPGRMPLGTARWHGVSVSEGSCVLGHKAMPRVLGLPSKHLHVTAGTACCEGAREQVPTPPDVGPPLADSLPFLFSRVSARHLWPRT